MRRNIEQKRFDADAGQQRRDATAHRARTNHRRFLNAESHLRLCLSKLILSSTKLVMQKYRPPSSPPLVVLCLRSPSPLVGEGAGG